MNIGALQNNNATRWYDITGSIDDSYLFKHVCFVNPACSRDEIKKEFIKRMPIKEEIMFVEKYIVLPVVIEKSLNMKGVCAFNDIPHPHFIYAVHITNMENVKYVSIKHRVTGEIFRTEVKKREISVPLAFDEDMPKKMFMRSPRKLSVIPTTTRYDSSSDITVHLEPSCNKKPATANIVLSVGYFNLVNRQSNWAYIYMESPSCGVPMYYVNGKELKASVHDTATFTSYSYDDALGRITEKIYKDTDTKPESFCSWLRSFFTTNKNKN